MGSERELVRSRHREVNGYPCGACSGYRVGFFADPEICAERGCWAARMRVLLEIARMVEFDRSALVADLERDEGRLDHVYRDILGIETAGVGHNLAAHGIDPASLPNPIPDETIDAWLEADIDDALNSLDTHCAPWWREMTDARQRGLINLCFMGWGDGTHGLSSFRNMLAALKAGDYETAATQVLASRYAREVGERAVRIAEMFRNG